MSRPDLSIVVVVYDMAREAPRTLHSLSPEYQRDVDGDRYEVIVVDNGSPVPLGERAVERHGSQFRYVHIAEGRPSPAGAMNLGVARSSAPWVGLIIDGARMVTPGVVSLALAALESRQDAVVETMAFHLGADLQGSAQLDGYDASKEDALLSGISWPSDGYRLFDISVFAASSSPGWFGSIAESTCMFMRREAFHGLGGYDERFDEPGGGFLNLDLYNRVVGDPRLTSIRLLGEGNFHQIHGGAATGSRPEARMAQQARWRRQYADIRGSDYRTPDHAPLLYGRVSQAAARSLQESIRMAWPSSPELPS